jgi:hypothetical protein
MGRTKASAMIVRLAFLRAVLVRASPVWITDLQQVASAKEMGIHACVAFVPSSTCPQDNISGASIVQLTCLFVA